MSKPKLKSKDHKALNALNDYLRKRSQLVLNQSVVRAATLERLERLRALADQMEVDDSPAMSLCGHKVYAWEFQGRSCASMRPRH